MVLKKSFVYISGWKHPFLGGASGIGIFRFDKETGDLEPVDLVREDLCCGVTCVDTARGILYVCIETEEHPSFPKGGGGRIIAFRVDSETGALTQVNEVDTFCPNPSYVSMDPTGKYLVVSNYSAYNAATKVIRGNDGKLRREVIIDDAVINLFGVNSDGSIGDMLDVAYHYGGGKKKWHPNPHCAVFSPSGNLFAVCDKGNDKIYMYTIDKASDKLVLCGEPYQDADESAPRYCRFHPTRPYFYVNHESNKEVAAFRYDEEGNLEPIACVSSVPDDCEYQGDYWHSGLLIHPSGKYLYCMQTDVTSMTVFEIDDEGTPKLIQHLETNEPRLRAFELSPDARFLIATTMQTGNIEVFAVGEDGRLTANGCKQTQKGAAYVTFFQSK